MLQNQIVEKMDVYDLDGLKTQPGRLNLPDAGKFLGHKTAQATYKNVERGTFPVTISAKGVAGFCVMKTHLQKYLQDGIPQPQPLFQHRTQSPAVTAPDKKRGRPTNKDKDAAKRAAAAKNWGEAC